MFSEIRAALKQWKDDTQYISKIAPSDWVARAHAHAQKTIIDLYAKIDAFEAESLRKSAEITALKAELTLKTLADMPTK